MIPGHEIVGLVAAVGAEVTKFKVGDKVRARVLLSLAFRAQVGDGRQSVE